MTAGLAVDSVLLVPKVACALPHLRWHERGSKLLSRCLEPSKGLAGVAPKQAHKVLNLDKLPDQREGRVPVLLFTQSDRSGGETTTELNHYGTGRSEVGGT